MGCNYSNFDGDCELYDEDINDGLGCDEDGCCICEDDPNPEVTCGNYESDGSNDDESDDEEGSGDYGEFE